QGRDGCAKPAHPFRCGELGVAQAVIDIVATEAPHECRSEVQLLQSAVRTHQSSNRLGTVLLLYVPEPVGDVFERSLPIHFVPDTTLLKHWLGQTIFTVEGFVGKTVAVSNPTF